jgi:hypothetical protein
MEAGSLYREVVHLRRDELEPENGPPVPLTFAGVPGAPTRLQVISQTSTSLTVSFAPSATGGSILNGGYQVGFRRGLLPAPPLAAAVGYKTQTFGPVNHAWH